MCVVRVRCVLLVVGRIPEFGIGSDVFVWLTCSVLRLFGFEVAMVGFCAFGLWLIGCFCVDSCLWRGGISVCVCVCAGKCLVVLLCSIVRVVVTWFERIIWLWCLLLCFVIQTFLCCEFLLIFPPPFVYVQVVLSWNSTPFVCPDASFYRTRVYWFEAENLHSFRMKEQILYWIEAGLLCDRSCFRIRTGIVVDFIGPFLDS